MALILDTNALSAFTDGDPNLRIAISNEDELALPAQIQLAITPIFRSELKAAGQPIPSNDIWIAATAREYGYPLVTRDTHFQRVRGIDLVPW